MMPPKEDLFSRAFRVIARIWYDRTPRAVRIVFKLGLYFAVCFGMASLRAPLIQHAFDGISGATADERALDLIERLFGAGQIHTFVFMAACTAFLLWTDRDTKAFKRRREARLREKAEDDFYASLKEFEGCAGARVVGIGPMTPDNTPRAS